jgi:hypothetical protein
MLQVVLVAAQLDLITGTIDKLLGGTDMQLPRVILLLSIVIVGQLQLSGDVAAAEGNFG